MRPLRSLSRLARSLNRLHQRLPQFRSSRRRRSLLSALNSVRFTMPGARKEIPRHAGPIQVINNLHHFAPSIWRTSRWNPVKRLNTVHLWIPQMVRRLKRRWRSSAGILLAVCLALGGAAYQYRTRKTERLLVQAKEDLRAGNVQTALFEASAVLQREPGSASACALIAVALSKRWPQEALGWFQRANHLLPGNVETSMAWARVALEIKRPGAAREALASIGSEGMDLPEFHLLAAQVAISNADLLKAEAELQRAVDLKPGDDELRFELANVDAHFEGAKRDIALATLEKMTTEPKIRVPALRALGEDAVAHGDVAKGLECLAKMKGVAQVPEKDRLNILSMLLRTNHPSFSSELRQVEAESASNGARAAGLAIWMAENQLALPAIEWLLDLPGAVRDQAPAQLALAQCYVAMRDWDRLQALAAKGDWQQMDFLRVALLARAHKEAGKPEDAAGEWRLAILKAGKQPQLLAMLSSMASSWGPQWEEQGNGLAWEASEQPNPPMWLLWSMHNRFVSKGDAEHLYRLTARLREIEPTDRVAQNNFVMLSLLLKQNEAEAREVARHLFEIYPDDPQTGSTYAYSLYEQGRPLEALEAMKRYPAALHVPAFGAYYGIFLAANGLREEALQYLALAKSAMLLPQERAMMDKARDSLMKSSLSPGRTASTGTGS